MSYLTVNGKSLSFDADYAIIDTGTSLFTVYEKDYKGLVSKLIDGFSGCVQSQGLVGCECESASDFSTFTVTLGSYDFDVLPEYYILEQEQGGTNYCFLLIQPANFELPGGKSAWILGDVFIRGYYMEFNMEEMTIGIAGGSYGPHKKSHSNSGSSFPVWGIVLIVIACLAVVGTAVVLLFLCNKRRNSPKANYVPLQQPMNAVQAYPPAQPQGYYAR